jgi:acyl transferase domain-containing protein/acyl carrier protein
MTPKEIQEWLVNHVARSLELDPQTVDIHEPFSRYGLSSREVIELSGDLEDFLERSLSPTLAYDYPSIFELAHHLAEGDKMEADIPAKPGSNEQNDQPIAIIGLSCRFPGAKDPEAYWNLLQEGKDAIREVPPERWDKETYYDPDSSLPGKGVSYWGGFLENIDQFDPFFFGISPVEAKYMDPQQRLLMELAYEAFDDAGQRKGELDGTRTGVFVGISINEYSSVQFQDTSLITSHSGTGSALSIAANRISYFFNFRGPSVAVDTACSSSLAAIHLACQSIRNGDCNMAIAGGVNMILSPAHSIAFSKAGVLAPDGRCKTFDARANGYVRGEGGGLVVLKSLSAALKDGDPVQALILGSTISQDGRTNGLMAPSQEAQEAMLRQAYQTAGISPGSIQYVETHGTGTLLGDSMEAKALGKVIGKQRAEGPCAIGSVKTNIGHLEAAAGIAGLIKVILSLKNKTLPPSLHYESPNPHIPFEELNLRVNSRLAPWPENSGPALAGLSSFGFGGTNVHMILQQAEHEQELDQQQEVASLHLLPLSARSEEALHSLARTFEQLLSPNSGAALEDICYAAARRRSSFDHRIVLIGHSREELQAALRAFREGVPTPDLIREEPLSVNDPGIVFVFAGQGGQWQGMGRELMEQEPVFRQTIEQLDSLIQEQFGWSLMNVFTSEPEDSRLDEIDIVQPAIFAVQLGLTALLQSWGIKPGAVIGHSMGEVAAAYTAGMLSLEDAIQVICGRSRLMKQLRGSGSMLLTELRPEQAREFLDEYGDEVNIAAVNSPNSTVLSGSTVAVEKVMQELEEKNLFCKLVKVDVASHSPQVDPLREALLKLLEGIDPGKGNTPFYSTVTGERGDKLVLHAKYWMDNLRQPVLFADVTEQLLHDGYSVFVEIGPHPVLLGSIHQTLQVHKKSAGLLPSLRREEAERDRLLRTMATLYTAGLDIDWSRLYPGQGNYIYLPPISWQRQRYWIETARQSSRYARYPDPLTDSQMHPLLGETIQLAHADSSYIWQTALNDKRLAFLEDHQIDEEVVLPAAAYIEMALKALEESGLKPSYEIADFIFQKKMILGKGTPGYVQAVLKPDQGNKFSLHIYSRTASQSPWTLHAFCVLVPQKTVEGEEERNDSAEVLFQQPGSQRISGEAFYQRLQSNGLQYGPAFRAVREVWQKGHEAWGQISLPQLVETVPNPFNIHPALLDACLQLIAATGPASERQQLYLPIECSRIRLFSSPPHSLISHVSLRPSNNPDPSVIEADVSLLDDQGKCIGLLEGFRLKRIERHTPPRFSREDTWLYELRWQTGELAPGVALSPEETKQWLIFADDKGLGEKLAEQLEAKGDQCHLLPVAEMIEQLEKEGEGKVEERVRQFISSLPSSLHGIIHCWSLSISPQASGDSRVSDIQHLLGCNSLLYLVQALSGRLARTPRLWLVTQGGQSIRPGEPVSVEQSALWGLGKVISFELPELKCVRIDLDPQQAAAEASPYLLRQLSVENEEDQIAFRDGNYYVLRLLPFLPKTTSQISNVKIQPDSTYLVSGGLGALGLLTAKWMVKKGARHLVLLGRSEPDDATKKVLEDMQREGVEVVAAQADVSNSLQLETVLDELKENMPPLRGIIHAAGVLDDSSLLNLNAERMKKVMAPKVEGSWNLHRASLDQPLDFFVLFSSAVSVLGSPGQGNYAAGSAYLDALAHYRRERGLPAISINWGPWAEVGLAAEAMERLEAQNASTEHLIKVIELEQGLEVLEWLLAVSPAQVAVLPFDLKNLLELYPAAAGMPFFAEVGGRDTHVARLYARPKLQQAYVAPRSEIERKLAELWQQTLHIDRIGIHDSFFELGGDSVLAAQILGLAQSTFGIRINPQDAFQAFTIEKLGEKLEEEIMKKIEAMSEEEAQRLLDETEDDV